MRKISLLDSGEFPNAKGISEPRSYKPLRQLEALGEIFIQDIFYVQSPFRGEPLREETKELYEQRQKARRKVEADRVKNTAENYRLKQPTTLDLELDLEPLDQLAEIVVLTQRPSEGRNNLLKALISQDHISRILLAPPYFRCPSKLSEIIGLDKERKIMVWVPYRNAAGVAYVKNRFPITEIAAANLQVICAPYPQDEFIREFCLPWLDAYFSIIGSSIPAPHVEQSTTNGLPVWSVSAQHGNGVVSMLLSTAGASFQNFDHCNLTLFGVKLESIELTSSLCRYQHHTPEVFFDSGVPSHDVIPSDINGSRELLRACIDDTRANEADLSTFANTQEFIDALLATASTPEE